MSLESKRGIAIFDCPDHYASLGLTIGASKGEIRKRYFQVARHLHPDSCPASMDKQKASRVLSKQVNPAYEILSQDKDLDEYKVLLRLVGQRAVREIDPHSLATEAAQALLTANDFEEIYQKQVSQLADIQFNSLEGTLEIAHQLSELNLAYLLRCEDAKMTQSSVVPRPTVTPAQSVPSNETDTAVTSPPATRPPAQAAANDQFVNQYCRRAEELIAKNRFQEAIVELRDALKLDPKSSRCHSLLGKTYWQQQQTTMAKVHFGQALKLDPGDVEALKGMAQLEKLEKRTNSKKSKESTPSKGPERKGLFGLFGSKK